MLKKTIAVVAAAGIIVFAGVLLSSVTPSDADKGGCPNAASANGASHANPNSAHGLDKQSARGCDTASPDLAPTATSTETATDTPTATPTEPLIPTATPTATPTDTPTPTPTDTPTPTPTDTPTPTATPVSQADVEVVSVFVNSPAGAGVGTPFAISASVDLRNNGPVPSVLVDTTFVPTLPSDCSATFGAVTVQNSTLAMGADVSISRSWTVTCTQPGSHTFSMNVSVAIDPAQTATDPNPGNNSGSGTSTTQIS